MKRLNVFILSMFLGAMIAFMGCQKEDEPDPKEKNESILPNSFSVDVPSSISAGTTKSSILKSTASDDTLSGNEIYSHLRTFIHTGESAAEIVGDIIQAISENNINKAITLSYESDDDGRTKNLEVVEDVTFDGSTWEFQMTISDADNASGAYGGKGLQVFWNRNPIEGIAIINPYNIDRSSVENWFTDSTLCRIDYSEAATGGYEKHMIVYISEIDLGNPITQPYAMETLKMFVGKNGSQVDVYGSSNHPNAHFFTSTTGFNWAFTAASYDDANIGVAEVGLPPSTLNESSRSVLLEDYSIKNVFTDQINTVYPGADSNVVNAYLHNTEAPGYFDSDGFIQGGTSPGNDYNDLETAIQNLAPYNPNDISGLTINFK